MASQTFSFTRDDAADDDVYDSDPIVVGAGEAVRVRFSDFVGSLAGAIAWLVIDANSVESKVLIDDREAWATGAVAESDVVLLRIAFKGRLGTIAGIIEGFRS